MSKKRKIVVVIAAYNESKTITSVVSQLINIVDQVIVVDDASCDKTSNLAKKAGATVISHSINLGQGAALETGFEFVRNYLTCDVVVTFDADNQFDAKEMPGMIECLFNSKVDVVLGSRFLGRALNMPLLRKVVLKIGIYVTWFFSGIKLTDTHNGFRAFKFDTLSKIVISQNRMAHASEIIELIGRNKLTFKEYPVTVKYHNDRRGQSNLNSLNIIRDILMDKFI